MFFAEDSSPFSNILKVLILISIVIFGVNIFIEKTAYVYLEKKSFEDEYRYFRNYIIENSYGVQKTGPESLVKNLNSRFHSFTSNYAKDFTRIQAIPFCSTSATMFNMPGGKIAISSAFLKKIPDLKTLEFFILKHIKHTINGDYKKKYADNLGRSLIVAFFKDKVSTKNLRIIQSKLGFFKKLRHSSEEETSASIYALEILEKKYNGNFSLYQIYSKLNASHESGNYPGYLYFHPMNSKLLEEIQYKRDNVSTNLGNQSYISSFDLKKIKNIDCS